MKLTFIVHVPDWSLTLHEDIASLTKKINEYIRQTVYQDMSGRLVETRVEDER